MAGVRLAAFFDAPRSVSNGCANRLEAQQKSGTVASAVILSKDSFDVVSVKQNKSDDKPGSNVPLTAGQSFSLTGGTFNARNQPLFVYVLFAYKVKTNEAWDLLNKLPKWVVSERFDIEAQSENRDPGKDQIRSMVRSLLEERFKLIAHREERDGTVLALRLAKPGKTGPQIKRHDAGVPCATQTALPTGAASVMTLPIHELLGTWPESCDGEQIGSSQRMRAGVRGMSMPEIAGWLSGEGDTDFPVVDRTGLEGNFDLLFEFAPEHGPDANIDQSAPTFKEALQNQLGLKLEKQKGVATFFVVDHIEHLTED